MFTYLDQTGVMGIRLPKDELEAFVKKYKTKLFESYGVVEKRLGHSSRRSPRKHQRTFEIPQNQPRIHQIAKAEVRTQFSVGTLSILSIARIFTISRRDSRRSPN